MGAAPEQHALREALADILLRELIVRREYDSVGRAADWIDGKEVAVDRILSGPLAPLIAERDAAVAELERVLDPEMKDLRLADGGIDMAVAGPMVERLAVALAGWFRQSGAENYIEMGMNARSEPFERYCVTVQKYGAASPHQLRTSAEARALAAEAERDEWKRLCDEGGEVECARDREITQWEARVETLLAERKNCDRRIRAQRLALRQNWEIVEMRMGTKSRARIHKFAHQRGLALRAAEAEITRLKETVALIRDFAGSPSLVRNDALDHVHAVARRVLTTIPPKENPDA